MMILQKSIMNGHNVYNICQSAISHCFKKSHHCMLFFSLPVLCCYYVILSMPCMYAALLLNCVNHSLQQMLIKYKLMTGSNTCISITCTNLSYKCFSKNQQNYFACLTHAMSKFKLLSDRNTRRQKGITFFEVTATPADT